MAMKLQFRLWFWTLVLCCSKRFAASDDTPDNIVNFMNFVRRAVDPKALKMTVLRWDEEMQSSLAVTANSCTVPASDPTIVTDVRSFAGTDPIYFEVIPSWQATGGPVYDSTTGECSNNPEDKMNCNKYKTIVNENARKFACAQVICPSLACATNDEENCFFTICKFDMGTPKGISYTLSGSDTMSCTPTSCPQDLPSCEIPGICTSTFIPQVITLDEESVTEVINEVRGVVFPHALHMPCIEWSPTLAIQAAEFVSPCKSPPSTEKSIIFDYRNEAITMQSLFLDWNNENKFYNPATGACTNEAGSCNKLKTLMNDQVNFVGCAQASCNSLNDGAKSATPFYMTVCKFDSPRPDGKAYEITASENDFCRDSSCPASKPKCFENLCCSSQVVSTTQLPPTTEELTTQPPTTVPETTHIPNKLCDDLRPNCSPSDCLAFPYEALKNCKGTCNNCDGCHCYDSLLHAKQCANFIRAPSACVAAPNYMRCPLTCNRCAGIVSPICLKPSTVPNMTMVTVPPTSSCRDERTDCTEENCKEKPHVYLQGCKFTCKNCDGCKCFDSPIKTGINCAEITPFLCTAKAGYQKCPLKCGKCQQIQDSSCVTTMTGK